jgi:hypothetical protein
MLHFSQQYSTDLKIARTIETQTTLFDENQQPNLIQLVYRDAVYPIYDSFSYDIISTSGSIIVDPNIYERF